MASTAMSWRKASRLGTWPYIELGCRPSSLATSLSVRLCQPPESARSAATRTSVVRSTVAARAVVTTALYDAHVAL